MRRIMTGALKRQIWFVMIGLVFVSTQSFAEKNPSLAQSASTSNTEQTLPFTLTISGGISLGSYEAGVNWALIDFMRTMRDDRDYAGKKPELKAITGASAGALNAVITAMLWSVNKDEEALLKQNYLQGENAVNDNIMRNAWVTVGIDELIPKDHHTYCNPTMTCPDPETDGTTPETKLVDELFARHAFKESAQKIRKLLDLPVFIKKPQSVDIALLATREDPVVIEKCGITVKNQRYVFLLQFVTDEKGYGHFESNPVKNIDAGLGTIAYLPQKELTHGSTGVDPNDVIRLMYASSAFPVAFGKVNLSYCTSEQEPIKDAPDRCPQGTYLASSDFIDGGVFDNVPLGAALSLHKARLSETLGRSREDPAIDREAAENYFFFISPSNRRNIARSFRDPVWKKPGTFGLSGIFGFVPGFIDAASDHELYTVLRSGKWKSYDESGGDHNFKLVVTDRYFPVTGSYLGHFGAFLDRPFREFDYNAGVYDIVNNLAKFMRVVDSRESKKQDGESAKYIYDALGINKANPASDVFGLIASQEQTGYNDPQNPWFWVNDLLPDSDGKPNTMYTIFRSIIKTSEVPLRDDDGVKTFNTFIMRLHQNEYINTGEHSEEMKWIMKKHDKDFTVWYAPLVGRAGKRLQDLQVAESRINHASGTKFLVGAASLGLDRYFDSEDKNLFFLPNSVPKREKTSLYNLIPYELGFDTANGGMSVSYLGRMQPRFARSLSLDLKLTPAGYNKFGDDRVGFSRADFYLSVNRVKNIWAFGAGPTFNYLWEQADEYHRANIGTALFVEFFQTVRITLGLRDNEARPLFGHNYYVTFGIVDLPGIANRIITNW